MATTVLKTLTFLALSSAVCCLSFPQRTPVDVLVREDRSTEGAFEVDIKSFGKTIHQLRMVPLSDGDIWADNAKTYILNQRDDGSDYLEVSNITEKEKVYHDPEMGSTLSIKGGEISGIINGEYTIRATNGRHHIYKSLPKKAFGAKDYLELPANIKAKEDYNRQILFKAGPDDYLGVPNRTTKGKQFQNRQTIPTYVVEILAVVDCAFASAVGTASQINSYLTVFFNSVKARFQTITNPKIVIRLVGSFIITTSAGEPFITANVYSGNKIYGIKTLSNFSEWVYRTPGVPPHDIAYLLTGKDLLMPDNSTNLAGVAWLGGVCARYPNISYSTGIGEDWNAFYDGIHTATHELAHVLGAPHDGGGAAAACPWGDGYIMSYIPATPNRVRFSNCSVSTMSSTMAAAACLNTNLTVTSPTGAFTNNTLPGQILTMNQQCQKLTNKTNAYVDTTVTPQSKLCYNLICKWPDTNGVWTMTTNAVAAEYSPCPTGGLKCINGACA